MTYLILEFSTEQEADDANEAIFDYIDRNYGAVRWSEIIESPEGTFYIASPTGDTRFPEDWKDHITGATSWNDKSHSRIMNGPEIPCNQRVKPHESRPRTIRGPPVRKGQSPRKTANRPSRHADEALLTPRPARSNSQ